MPKIRQITVESDPLVQHSWRIWGYCRDNRSSPDAERHAKRVADLLRVTVELMTAKATEEIQQLQAEVAQLKKEAVKETTQKKTGMAEVRWKGWLETKIGREVAARVTKHCGTVRSLHVGFIAGANYRPNNADKE